MRRPNIDRMRKANLATIYALYPRRWVLGMAPEEELLPHWLTRDQMMWSLSNLVPTFGFSHPSGDGSGAGGRSGGEGA